MFCSTNRMSSYEVPFYCRVNLSLKRAEEHVINAIVNIRKSVFQTAECGLKLRRRVYLLYLYFPLHIAGLLLLCSRVSLSLLLLCPSRLTIEVPQQFTQSTTPPYIH